MAFFLNDYSSSGLNDISSLDLPLDLSSKKTNEPPTLLSLHSSSMSDPSKAKATGGGLGSRIPKISFGFRKQTRNGSTVANNDCNTWSERSTPEGCEGSPPVVRAASGTQSASSSNNSSPTIGRSKSLRLPRSNYTKYKFQMTQSKVDSGRDEAEDFYPDDLVESVQLSNADNGSTEQRHHHHRNKTGQTGLVRPRSATVTAGSSNSSNRSSSPGCLTMSVGTVVHNGSRELDRGKFGFYGDSLSQGDFTGSAAQYQVS